MIAAEVAGTAASGIRAIANAAWAVPGAIHLEFGEPDFATPAHIVEAAHAAARTGHTRYGPSTGLPALREAIAAKLARDNGLGNTAPDRIVVGAGGVGALFAAYRTLLGTGDEILVPDPGWTNFSTLATMLGAVPRGYRLDPAANHGPDYDHLESLRGPRTRAILVNSPSNPVGYQWDAGQLAAVGEWAAARNLVVVSDECYDQLWLDRPAVPFAAAAPGVPAVTVYSLSKSYAMTGWRVGYAVTTPELAAGLARVQEATASCVNTVAQHAAVAALTGDQTPVRVMRDAYRDRRDIALRTALELGLSATRPAGAFYLWLRTEVSPVDLLHRTGTAVAPGPAFGAEGAGHVRLSLAAAPDDIVRGLTNIAQPPSPQ
ncbi:aminotransferase class I/II-fold pyridoxal phosphate-dependent enzyme [Dactylosporangium sp. NPDC049140]|uniref:pyridoxal phosphate-dependent aminotransferase n=1 Tax=Dactylosporangium sp. NPDC049140 TaxID=3155647 RepID=UPI003402BA4B